jgi:hypothetical protein
LDIPLALDGGAWKVHSVEPLLGGATSNAAWKWARWVLNFYALKPFLTLPSVLRFVTAVVLKMDILKLCDSASFLRLSKVVRGCQPSRFLCEPP